MCPRNKTATWVGVTEDRLGSSLDWDDFSLFCLVSVMGVCNKICTEKQDDWQLCLSFRACAEAAAQALFGSKVRKQKKIRMHLTFSTARNDAHCPLPSFYFMIVSMSTYICVILIISSGIFSLHNKYTLSNHTKPFIVHGEKFSPWICCLILGSKTLTTFPANN